MATRIVIYTTLLLTGCVSTPTAGSRPRADANAVVIHVENYNWSDAVIYAVRSGSKIRLGDVRSNERKALSVPVSFTSMGTLELYIRFIGSSATLATRPIPVIPGQHIEVVLRNYVPFSTVIPLATVGTVKRADAMEYEPTPLPRIFPLRQAFTGINGGRNDV